MSKIAAAIVCVGLSFVYWYAYINNQISILSGLGAFIAFWFAL